MKINKNLYNIRLYDPISRGIYINGDVHSKYNVESLRNNMGIVY